MKPIVFALATPLARSALAVIRVTGPSCMEKVVSHLRHPRTGEPLTLQWLQHRAFHYAVWLDEQEQVVDDGMFSFFKGPYSYTGEDMVEISCHGNPVILDSFFRQLRRLGFEDAKPGEFTGRAVSHGKMDLSQAEGVHEIIMANSRMGLKMARQSMEGRMGDVTQHIRHQIIELLANLEAHIDFDEADVGVLNHSFFIQSFGDLKKRLEELLSTYKYGEHMKDGLSLCLCGVPNSGKSTLFNNLLRHRRAIVTHIPGTTRDVLRERCLLDGREFFLFDTAGIRETHDPVERLGVERTAETMNQTTILSLLIDTSLLREMSIEKQFEEALALLNVIKERGSKHIVVTFTKNDLCDELLGDKIEEKWKFLSDKLMKMGFFHISKCFVNHSHIIPFEKIVIKTHDELYDRIGECSAVLLSSRQRDKVEWALQKVIEAEDLFVSHQFTEIIASVLQEAQYSLAEIVGEVELDAIYDKIFSSFCIGK